MENKGLVGLIIVWVAIKILNYYFSTVFLLSIILFLMFLYFLIMSVVQIRHTIKERKHISKSRIQKLTVYSLLLVISFLFPYTNTLIEKADWHLQYTKRKAIVEQVRNYKLTPNTENKYYPWCKLPFIVPVVSNDGNEIIIRRENSLYPKISVGFIIYTGFLDHPSTMLVYSDDPFTLKDLEERIKNDPRENWKIEKNWYRTQGML